MEPGGLTPHSQGLSNNPNPQPNRTNFPHYQYKRKTWKGKMIKNVLTRRKGSDTYLAAVSRHRWSTQIAMKVDKVSSFLPALRPSSANSPH